MNPIRRIISPARTDKRFFTGKLPIISTTITMAKNQNFCFIVTSPTQLFSYRQLNIHSSRIKFKLDIASENSCFSGTTRNNFFR